MNFFRKRKKIHLIQKEIKDKFEILLINEELDKDFDELTGIAFSNNFGVNCTIASSSVDNAELFPENFDALFLQSPINVPPEYRFFAIYSYKIKGSKLKMEFKDDGMAYEYPYMLRIYLRLEKY